MLQPTRLFRFFHFSQQLLACHCRWVLVRIDDSMGLHAEGLVLILYLGDIRLSGKASSSSASSAFCSVPCFFLFCSISASRDSIFPISSGLHCEVTSSMVSSFLIFAFFVELFAILKLFWPRNSDKMSELHRCNEVSRTSQASRVHLFWLCLRMMGDPNLSRTEPSVRCRE